MWEISTRPALFPKSGETEDVITYDGKVVHTCEHKYASIDDYLREVFDGISFPVAYGKKEGWPAGNDLLFIDIKEEYYLQYLMVSITSKHDESLSNTQVYELYSDSDTDTYIRINSQRSYVVRDSFLIRSGKIAADVKKISISHHKNGSSQVEIRLLDLCVTAPEPGCQIDNQGKRYLAHVDCEWTEDSLIITCHFMGEEEKNSNKYAVKFVEGFPTIVSQEEIDPLGWMDRIHNKYDMVQNPYNSDSNIQPPKFEGNDLYVSYTDDYWIRIGESWIVVPEDSIGANHLSQNAKSEYCMYKNLVL